MAVHWNEEQSSTAGELPVPAGYIESERRAALFTRIAKTAIERVFVLIMVSPVLVLFDAGETDRLLAHQTMTTRKNTTVRRISNHAFCKNA
jgi:hypothetical protein